MFVLKVYLLLVKGKIFLVSSVRVLRPNLLVIILFVVIICIHINKHTLFSGQP